MGVHGIPPPMASMVVGADTEKCKREAKAAAKANRAAKKALKKAREAERAGEILAEQGVAAEVIACGDAEGGIEDVNMLRRLMAGASPPVAGRREQDDRIRWGTLFALTLLQQHPGALDRLAVAFEASDDVGTCIAAIERDLASGRGLGD